LKTADRKGLAGSSPVPFATSFNDRDQGFQKRGYGEYLLMDAQAKVDHIAQKTGVRGMVLDARNEELVRWYEEHDFARKEGSLRMFKSIDLIRKLKLNE